MFCRENSLYPEYPKSRGNHKIISGMKIIANAAAEDLCKVEGISRKTAEKVYDFFHG